MPVEGEDSSQPEAAHEPEAGAIDQAEAAPVGGEHGLDRSAVLRRVDPLALDHRQQLIDEAANSRETESILDQRQALSSST